MANYWIVVASAEHVSRGVEGGFMQVCHGKQGPLKRIKPGDGVIYYSPHEVFGKPSPCRQFTACGSVGTGEPYEFKMSDDFIPWRRNVTFVLVQRVAIEPLLDKLSFIHNKQHWGFPFRRGCFQIPESDFRFIALNMGVKFSD